MRLTSDQIDAPFIARDNYLSDWGGQYPATAGLWRSAWTKFIPFLDYDIEIRRIICSTNAIESLDARFR